MHLPIRPTGRSRRPRHSRIASLAGAAAAAVLLAGTTALAASPVPARLDAGAASLVGAWLLTFTDDPNAVPATSTMQADGTLTLVTADGVFSGVWQPNADGTATATMAVADENGIRTVRSIITPAPDFATFTASYTLEPHCLCGDTLGELGPGEVSATRIALEAPGMPVAPIPTPEPEPSPEPGPSPDASAGPA